MRSQSLREQYQVDLKNARDVIENLTSELEYSNSKVEFLKEKLQNTNQTHKEEIAHILENNNETDDFREKINNLEIELNSLDQQLMKKNEELNRQISETDDLINIITDLKAKMNQDRLTYESDIGSKIDQIKNLETRISRIENEKLNEVVLNLQEKRAKTAPPINDQKLIKVAHNSIPNYLFLNMMDLMTENGREIVFNQLVTGLDGKNREQRTNSIKLMGLMGDDQSFNKLKGLVHDSDWLIKLYLIKALEKFRKPEIIDLLSELKSDNDPDVRETAEKTLNKMRKILLPSNP